MSAIIVAKWVLWTCGWAHDHDRLKVDDAGCQRRRTKG